MVEDGKGNMWFGTRNGLVKYDGYGMQCYYHINSEPKSVISSFVKALFLDSRKRIWVGTGAGMSRYSPDSDDFCSYPGPGSVSTVVETKSGRIISGGDNLCVYDEKTDSFIKYPSLEAGFIISMALDADDNLFVASNSSIFYYDSSLTKITRLDTSLYSDFLTGIDGIIPMTFDHAGNLWIGRNGKGVMRVNRRTGKARIYEPAEISNGIVRTIAEDGSHRIWLGTEKGVTIIYPDGRIEIIRHDFQMPNLLSDNAIYSILCDRNRNIWIGSYFGGVDVLLSGNMQFRWTEPGNGPHNIKGKVVRMMAETSPGTYWIATEDMGISIYDAADGTFTLFDGLPQMGTNVHSLYYDRPSGDMWIGTFRRGLFRYNPQSGKSRHYLLSNGLASDAIFYIAKQRNGRIWVATTQGLRYYDRSTDTFVPAGDGILDGGFVYTLFVDREDNLWAGTVTSGLFRIDGKTGKVSRWAGEDGDSGLCDDYVTCLYQGRDGIMWVGTNNCGLHRLDPATGRVEVVSNEMLLPRYTICSINEDMRGRIWVGTSMGLYQYNPADKAILRFTTDNGLPTNNFNFSSTLTTSGGQMFFGSLNGIIAFSPLHIDKDMSSYEVHLKNLTIDNRRMTVSTEGTPLTSELDETPELRLTYGQARSFCIEYGVIMPGMANAIEYQVRLDGIDDRWRDVGTERRFYGYGLQPGTYTLRIRANGSNAGWEHCREKVLRIVVQPPFYRSWWAYLVYVIMTGLAALFAIRLFRTRMQEKNAVKMARLEKEKIEEIDRAKFDFFTTVSHELRTPLSLIVAPLKSISRQELNTESQKHLDTAIKNTRKMEELIGELVTFNKIETDNFPFYIQKGNPLEFLALAVQPFRETSAERGITLTLDSEDNGEDVWFSPSYLERIVNNLLSNAIKFTAEGGAVTVKANITGRDNSNFTYLHMDVADTGIGIVKEELENIFDRYYQTKRGYNVNNCGWGIGLSLVKRLVEVHKGTVGVTSEVGVGSTFSVWLNVSADAFPEKSRIADDKVIVPVEQYRFSPATVSGTHVGSDDAAQSDNGLTILIVEDNADLLSFMYDYFSSKYTILTATDGQKALQIAREQPVQLVISDVMMPGMDGTELCRTLKGDMRTSHIPVILLTAKSESEDVVAGYESGAEAYVSKPFDPNILELQVKNILQLMRVRQTEIRNAGSESIDSTSLSGIDKDFIRRLTELVDKNIGNSDFAVVDITRSLGVSRSLLHVKMKNLMNMSTGDYIRKKRMERACQMLRKGYNVLETAYATGFSDPNYFSKTFKKHIGMSPTEYAAGK